MSRGAQGNPILKELFQDRHFVAAVAILAIAAGTWRVAVGVLKISLQREAVPWPAQVTVDGDFRNTSFLKVLGPYARVEEDGLLDRGRDGNPHKDGAPDGENIHNPAVLEVMGMGTSTDKKNIPMRISNWYLARTYEDARETVNSPYKFWRLNITYYTGGLDTVPHIPESCWKAGGMSIVGSSGVNVQSPAGVPDEWKGNLKWQRVLAEDRSARQYLGYYIFSLNGKPEDSREQVRVGLMSPWIKHCYFAMIEVAPRGSTTNTEEMDRRTRDFIQACLPAVLKDLPMPSDVRKLAADSQ